MSAESFASAAATVAATVGSQALNTKFSFVGSSIVGVASPTFSPVNSVCVLVVVPPSRS